MINNLFQEPLTDLFQSYPQEIDDRPPASKDLKAEAVSSRLIN